MASKPKGEPVDEPEAGFGPVTIITAEGSTEGYLMPDDSIKVAHPHPDYEAKGIFPDTWACIGVMSEADAQGYLFELMASAVDCRIARDPDGKRWHVAVQGGLADSPTAWLVGIRGRFEDSIRTCTGPTEQGQHPMEPAP
jgi:hypothetical protein